MIKGRVTDQVWSSKCLESLPFGALLEVLTEEGGRLIAYDPLGCAEGEAVLITQGSVAARHFAKNDVPVDALIIGSIDEE